jgi:hypothetical protein
MFLEIEPPMIEESPEPSVWCPIEGKFRGSGNYPFQSSPQEESENLNEQLADVDRLRAEIEDLSEDGREASETKAQEPHAEGENSECGVVVERHQTGSIIFVSYNRPFVNSVFGQVDEPRAIGVDIAHLLRVIEVDLLWDVATFLVVEGTLGGAFLVAQAMLFEAGRFDCCHG